MNPGLPAPNYLSGYPEALQAEARAMISEGRLAGILRSRYGELHGVRTDAALYEYTMVLKSRHLRSSEPVSKVAYDNRLHVIQNALGTHTTIARVQGNRLKAKREIRIAGVFRAMPEPMLKMIVVHELAHLKEREHGKAFYALCQYMESDYHQLELDLRLALMQGEASGQPVWPAKA